MFLNDAPFYINTQLPIFQLYNLHLYGETNNEWTFNEMQAYMHVFSLCFWRFWNILHYPSHVNANMSF